MSNLLAETTANTLCATLGLLAVYQDVQEHVYQSIMNALGDRAPVNHVLPDDLPPTG